MWKPLYFQPTSHILDAIMIRPLVLLVIGILGTFSMGLVYLGVLYFQVPDVAAMKGCMKTSMFELDLCPGKGNYTRLNAISPHLRAAIIASEDVSFYSHNGFDFAELEASVKRNLDRGAFVRGGSTITQQLAKNVFLTSEKTLTRKLIEARLTQEIERQFTKDQILEKYLNVVQFGESLFGVRAASQYYFKKTPAELTVLESAFLTMLLPNPVKYSVSYRRKELSRFAQSRIQDIIFKLKFFGKIDESQYSFAKANISVFPWDGSKGPLITPTATPMDSDSAENSGSEVPLEDEE